MALGLPQLGVPPSARPRCSDQAHERFDTWFEAGGLDSMFASFSGMLFGESLGGGGEGFHMDEGEFAWEVEDDKFGEEDDGEEEDGEGENGGEDSKNGL